MTQVAAEVHGSVAIPEAEHRIEPTSKSRIDEALAILEDHKQDWVALDIEERIDLLDKLRNSMVEVAESWVAASVQGKRMAAGTAEEGEEWMTGPGAVLRNVTLLISSLEDIREYGVPQLPKPAYARPDGQVVAPVLPANGWDGLLFQGFTGEVWMDPEVKLDELGDQQASFYKRKSPKGKVALVLGAGNHSSIGPMDALYKLFVEGQVVVMKMNPVNENVGPFVDQAFAPLSERGFFKIVYGGVTEGDYLCKHSLVDEIHITGSDKTHDAIVYGVGEEGARRKATSDPLNDKRLTCELGNVSPVIVVPGPWSQKDLDFHGVNVASSVCNNSGYNCSATRVVVQHEQWDKRDAFVASMQKAFKNAGDRAPYYPGSEARHQTFLEHHPDADQFGTQGEGYVPWTLMHHLDPNDASEICFNMESWCGQTSEVALPAGSVAEYIDQAVAFCNERIWGTLNASIIVHPKSLKDPAIAEAVERAIANLRYGTVAVNHWAGLNFALVTTTWGAFPGHTIDDIRSGQGVVHNTYMFDRPQKTVLRGPFRVFPTPAWFVNNKNAAEIGRKMTYFNADPSLVRLPGLLWAGLRG
ncbi:MAG: aldehyde dehydrogenase [Myxococcales bacterium]|nr:MAG: aldehyde dehydrogenase [Myxococcales bacterium]